MKTNPKYCLLFLLIASFEASAQPTQTQNYVVANTVKQSGIITQAAVDALPIGVQAKNQTVSYFDGLGRLTEQVLTKASASQKDLVTGIEYDPFGREIKKNLPYADQSSSLFGGFKDRWSADQLNFYQGGLPNVDQDINPYSQAILESSPLNRILAQGMPGADWQPNMSNAYDPSEHTVSNQYLVNRAEDYVRVFSVDSVGNITSPGYYPRGQLNLLVTTDEQQQVVRQYTDKSGHVIVKRVLANGDSLQTYFLYDNQDKLRAVIQPEGTAALQAAAWIIPIDFVGKWMFLYRFDQRNRLVMKKVPGADSVNMIYDQWDRIVLTQDGNMRAASPKQYLFTKYDQLNRPVVTGQITDTRALSAVVSEVAAASGRYETVSTSATEGYTLTGSFPSSASYALNVYTTTHYDSYSNLPSSWSASYAFVTEYGVATQNTFLSGQVVATQTRVLGTNTFYRTVTYYDDKYRLIQTTSDNAAGGKDRITRILTFDGKVTSDYHTHSSRFYTTALVTQQGYTYDHLDRLLNTTHKTASQEIVTLSQNTYNELGQLLNKKLHQSTSHPTALQKLDYYYNIRGWLKSINQPYPTNTGYEESDLFNLQLNYDIPVVSSASVAQYNGNIAEECWKGGYDEYQRSYTFNYDQANRITNSFYGYLYNNGFGNNWSFTRKYDEDDIHYDRNGNFMNLDRYHGDYNKIDQLYYKNYTGNQLGRVEDYADTAPIGFQDKDNGSGSDYFYDANGNMKSDYNKSVSSISYNYLNLPNVVTITSKGTITYTYDALGNNLQKAILDQTVSPNKVTNYYYAGDYVYRNDTLEFISHPDGRIRPVRIDTTQAISIANLKYIYDYFLKDHLGSVRSVLTTEQQTDIYAATMEAAASTKENALFSNISSTGSAKPAGMTNDVNNQKASKLNGAIGTTSNKRVGPATVLKVMAGDTVSLSTWSWYTGSVQPAATGVSAIATDLLPLLTSGVAAAGGSHGGAIPTSTSDPMLSTDLNSFIANQPYVATQPKAYLNWMIVDEEFAAVSSTNHVGAKQIPACNSGDTLKQTVGLNQLVVRRNGWIYVYVSNESSQDVYFDNLVVNLRHGPLVEQKDYYAFGMEIPGLSTKAIKYKYDENRIKYNGIENDTALGLNNYEAHFRQLDPAIGRWWQIDPKIEYGYENVSPYSSMHNNPVSISDPLGDFDDYKLKKDGNIELVKKTSDKNDVLYATDKKGAVDNEKSITVAKGVLNNINNQPAVGENTNGSTTLGTITDKGSAQGLFRFLSDNSSVEWGMISIGDQSTGQKVQDTRITTSHSAESNRSLGDLVNKYLDEANESGRSIFEVTHSHPATAGYFVDFPSGFHRDGSKSLVPGDRDQAKDIEDSYKKNKVVMSVYDVSSKGYIYYNSQAFSK